MVIALQLSAMEPPTPLKDSIKALREESKEMIGEENSKMEESKMIARFEEEKQYNVYSYRNRPDGNRSTSIEEFKLAHDISMERNQAKT